MRSPHRSRRLVGLAPLGLTALLLALAWMWPRLTPKGRDQRPIERVPTTAKVVAITFDDGPHPVFTPRILQLLNRYHARATFFMIGREMDKHPEIVLSVVKAGHAIGNHTYNHLPHTETRPLRQLLKEMAADDAVIKRLTGTPTTLFRPPRGFISGNVLKAANQRGYRTILWTVCADHHDAPTPEAMARRVLKVVRPGDIVLLHDGLYPSRWKDVAATELILKALQARGYRFVTVPELLRMGQ